LAERMDGRELCKIQERMLHLRDSMEIEGRTDLGPLHLGSIGGLLTASEFSD
jgi:hypothetical protein